MTRPSPFAAFFTLILLGCASSFIGSKAHAQAGSSGNRQTTDQFSPERTKPVPALYPYNAPLDQPYTFGDFINNLHGSYFVSLMGPRLMGDSNTTYNIYLPDVAPIQLFHAFQLGYQVNNNLQIGIKESIVQNLVDGIEGTTGTVRNHSFDWYDPAIYFNLPNLIQVPGWSVFTSASFSLVVTPASQNLGRITSVIIDQSWTVNTYPSAWSYGFNLRLNPLFYTDPIPDNVTSRQTLYVAFGPFLGYQVAPTFNLQMATNFDAEHLSPDDQGFFHFGESLPDVLRFEASVTPNIYPLNMSIGLYYQMLIWNPSIDTSIIGADFTIGF